MEFHSELQQKINFWGCTLVKTKLNAFARQMSPPEMKFNAQYGNFMLLCSHGGGGGRNLKTAAGFQVLLQILDNSTCVMIKRCVGVKTAWGMLYVDFSTCCHLYFTFIHTVCPNAVALILKLLTKRECTCFARIGGKTLCCAQQETNDKTTAPPGF